MSLPKTKKTNKINAAASLAKSIKKDRLKPKPSQSEAFVSGRSPVAQYFLDVFALAFVLSIIFIIIERLFK